MYEEEIRKKSECLYPIFFGVSCALVALRNSPKNEKNDDKWLETKNIMLQGSAHLLGLLVWRVQIEEFIIEKHELFNKLENAKNEIEELKKRRSEDGKANEKVLGIFAAHEQRWFIERKQLRQEIGSLVNELRVLESNKNEEISKLNEKVKEKDILMISKDKALEEIEEKIKRVENEVDEVKKVHSNEIWKHKSAFIELVSTQRQFEADMGRALKQVEETKRELDMVLDEKEESVLMTQRLSFEVVKLRRDLEQKEKILSAMLRKSKLDTAEKQMLLNEVKLSKNKRKPAELQSENRGANSKGRNEKVSLRSMLSKGTNLKAFSDKKMQSTSTLLKTEQREESVCAANFKELEGWVRSEAEKYANTVDEKHHHELEAFAEQLRLKEEKLEAYQWRLMNFEIESKRLISQIEGLDQKLSHLKQENLKMESLLLDQETELHSLKTQLSMNSYSSPTFLQEANINSSNSHDWEVTHDPFWSKVKIIKRKPVEMDQETESFVEIPQETEIKLSQDIVCNVQTPKKEFGEEKGESEDDEKFEYSVKDCLETKKNFPWKMDLHALGVSYKIKRLKQQLVMFEKFKGKQKSVEDGENGKFGRNGFYTLMSLLNKQVTRYISLQGNIDDLCKRMHDNNIARTKAESKTLEQFLTETFHLQRYIVATGQKLMELQSKIASVFVDEELEDPTRFDSKVFTDNLRNLFKEVQRGVEVRIAKIIGDLEGTLACEGISHLSR